MKILRVISSMDPSKGGPCQGIRNSIPALNDGQVENEVVCMDDPTSPYLQFDNFPIHAVGAAKGPWAYNSNLGRWLSENLNNFDIVVVHGLWLYHSYIAINRVGKLKERNSPKIFIMPHGMLDPWFQRDKTRRLKALRNEVYWWLIEKKVVNTADGLLFTCEQELKLARETFSGYKPKAELNVGYGIQPPPACTPEMLTSFRLAAPTLENRPYILFLSRIHPKKAIDLLIDAYIKVHKYQYDLPDLIIAGPLDGNFSEEMVKKAKACPNIHFTGMIQGNAKWGAFYGAEAFILPSHQENFGIAVAEALACGKPVLISDQVNIYKEILSGGAGLIEKDTIEGIEELLIGWSRLNLHNKVTMSKNAIAVYKEHFSIEEAAKKFRQAIESN